MTEREKYLILLETSTLACSAALSCGERIIGYKESDEPKAHASRLAVFVKELLDENNITVSDCAGVVVSKGPGSYTGLRVGVSTAKGLSFGAGIPLISVGTLDTLAFQAISERLVPEGCDTIIPMIDARRMEVYCSIFDASGKETGSTEAKILDSGSFGDILSKGKVLFIGDGAGKFSEILDSPNATFINCCPKASSMLAPALAKLRNNEFEDTAYFEPFYLKEFVATKSKKELL